MTHSQCTHIPITNCTCTSYKRNSYNSEFLTHLLSDWFIQLRQNKWQCISFHKDQKNVQKVVSQKSCTTTKCIPLQMLSLEEKKKTDLVMECTQIPKRLIENCLVYSTCCFTTHMHGSTDLTCQRYASFVVLVVY